MCEKHVSNFPNFHSVKLFSRPRAGCMTLSKSLNISEHLLFKIFIFQTNYLTLYMVKGGSYTTLIMILLGYLQYNHYKSIY